MRNCDQKRSRHPCGLKNLLATMAQKGDLQEAMAFPADSPTQAKNLGGPKSRLIW